MSSNNQTQNRFFIILFFLSYSIFCKSQVLVGLKGGWTSCTPSFQPQAQINSTLDALTFGMVGIIQKERNVAIRAELNYVSKGWDELILTRKIDSSLQITQQLRGIELPVYANFILGNGKLKFHFLAGTYFTLYLQEDSKIKSNLLNLTNSQLYKKFVQNSNFNPLEIGISVGAGISYDLSNKIGRIQADIRFNKGLTNTYNISSNRKMEYSQLDLVNINFSYLYYLRVEVHSEPIKIKEE